ncbi:MAG: hypothetical protein ABI583_04395 [Betaproteobacteria bacterium]
MKTLVTSLACAMFGAFLLILATNATARPNVTGCPLEKLAIFVGMSRTEVERAVAASMGVPSKYSAYANNLEGGAVEYTSGGCILKVDFSAGAPAPRVALPSGRTKHLQPMEEKVLAYELHFIPLRAPSTPEPGFQK